MPKRDDLLAEPLSDAEVQTLLERLGAHEFGGPETATLGAVVEATGSDAATVGRLLAEVRKEDFEKRFGLELKDHGRRIESLEERANKESQEPRNGAAKRYLREEPERNIYHERSLDLMAREDKEIEEHGLDGRWQAIIFALFIIFIATFPIMCGRGRV